MEAALFNSVSPLINASFFGYNSASELIEHELNPEATTFDTPLTVAKSRFKRNSNNDVMYVNVGGSQADNNACPSIADSAAVSLAQMAFLSMTVSIFTVVATVANNINNNNNNHNENNLNFVQQKQNSLSMNQNIVNQINIDLPPPVPGKRAISDVIMENEIKSMLEQKIHKYKACQNKTLDFTPEAAKAIMNILRGLTSQKWTGDSPNQRECIGRELCLKSLGQQEPSPYSSSPVQKVVYLIESFALLYMQLDDHSGSFGAFIQAMTRPVTPDECFHMFPKCGVDEDYEYKPIMK